MYFSVLWINWQPGLKSGNCRFQLVICNAYRTTTVCRKRLLFKCLSNRHVHGLTLPHTTSNMYTCLVEYSFLFPTYLLYILLKWPIIYHTHIGPPPSVEEDCYLNAYHSRIPHQIEIDEL